MQKIDQVSLSIFKSWAEFQSKFVLEYENDEEGSIKLKEQQLCENAFTQMTCLLHTKINLECV